jgi:hypothetical protein
MVWSTSTSCSGDSRFKPLSIYIYVQKYIIMIDLYLNFLIPPPSKIQGEYFKLCYDLFVPYPFKFSVHCHPSIWSYWFNI